MNSTRCQIVILVLALRTVIGLSVKSSAVLFCIFYFFIEERRQTTACSSALHCTIQIWGKMNGYWDYGVIDGDVYCTKNAHSVIQANTATYASLLSCVTPASFTVRLITFAVEGGLYNSHIQRDPLRGINNVICNMIIKFKQNLTHSSLQVTKIPS